MSRVVSILVSASCLAALTFAVDSCYTSRCVVRRGDASEVIVRDKASDFSRPKQARGIPATTITLLGAAVSQEMDMAICRNAIVTCALERTMCDHAECMGRCERAKFDSYGFPTFEKAIEIYSLGNSCYRRKRMVANGILSCLKLIGVPPSSSTVSLTDDDFDRMVEKMREAGLENCTIASKLGYFDAIASKKLKPLYKQRGFRLPLFDIPNIEVERKEVVLTTDEQEVALTQRIYALRAMALGETPCHATTRKASRDQFVALFFQRMFAMRNGDINNLKWGNIKLEPEGRILRYRPHKTPYKESDILIDRKLWALVAPFAGNDDEYVIVRHNSGKA